MQPSTNQQLQHNMARAQRTPDKYKQTAPAGNALLSNSNTRRCLVQNSGEDVVSGPYLVGACRSVELEYSGSSRQAAAKNSPHASHSSNTQQTLSCMHSADATTSHEQLPACVR
jgi:6-phosphogluconolactonase (cycloisomerase 2 family)